MTIESKRSRRSRLDPKRIRDVEEKWHSLMVSTTPVDRVRAERELDLACGHLGHPIEEIVWCRGLRELAEAHVPCERYLLDRPEELAPWQELEQRWRARARRDVYSTYNAHLLFDRHTLGYGPAHRLWIVVLGAFREGHLEMWEALEGALWHVEADYHYEYEQANLDWRHELFPLWDLLLGAGGPFTEEEHDFLRAFLEFGRAVPWWIIGLDANGRVRALLLERPVRVRLRRGVPHSQSGPAVLWGDGEVAYALDGTQVAASDIEPPTLGRIDREEKIELKRALVENYGWERYLEARGGALVAQDECGCLWRVDLDEDRLPSGVVALLDLRGAMVTASLGKAIVSVPQHFAEPGSKPIDALEWALAQDPADLWPITEGSRDG